MELFQELLFTISFSLIVSLLIAKLFSVTSNCDDGNSTLLERVDEKIEREWVVCDSEKEEKEKSVYFEDAVKVSEDVVFGCPEAELVSGFAIHDPKSVGGVGKTYPFDESHESTEFEDDAVFPVKIDQDNAADLISDSDVRSSIDDFVDSIEANQESPTAIGESYVFDESPLRTESKDDPIFLVKNDETNAAELVFASDPRFSTGEDDVKSSEVDHKSSAIDVGEVIIDDDWQGIETTELEKKFGAAVAYLGSKKGTDRVNLLDNEVKMQFYGLQRVAIEGPCSESQPMALKVSARANWNAWKRLENLGREEAMEQYIALLSQHVPDWMETHAFVDEMQ